MLKRLINKIYKTPLFKIKNEGKLYYIMHKGKKLFAPDERCFNGVYRHIFIRKIYDFKTTSSSPVIIDGGANIGLGIIYWKERYPNCEIIAFEPSKLIYECLSKNIENNNITGVKLINKALFNVEKKILFTTNEALSGSINLTKDLQRNYEVEAVLLSKYINRKIDFLKLDIEGAEIVVMEEIKEKLQNIDSIFIEYHSFVNEKQGLSKILKILEDKGFRYYIEKQLYSKTPLVELQIGLNQDLQLNIWAVNVQKQSNS